jgi:DNA-binding transcriptional regulator YhcF (GntR family)
MLDQGSIISTQHGRGTYILPKEDQKQENKKDQGSIEDLTRYYLRKAAYLGFEPEEIKTCFERISRENKRNS